MRILNDEYAIHVELKGHIDDDPSSDELEFILQFMPEIVSDMLQYLGNNKE